MLIKLVLLLLLFLPVSAEDVFLEPGRIALIDFGSLIESEPQVLNRKLLRAYVVSGLEDESASSVLALQGLQPKGETDVTISTSSGLYQLRVILNNQKTTDLNLNPSNSRLKIYTESFSLSTERSSIITLPRYLNKKILVGDPDLINVSQFLNYYDDDFLKVISLLSSSNQGTTDLILPSQSGVYKLKVDVNKGNSHETNINLI